MKSKFWVLSVMLFAPFLAAAEPATAPQTMQVFSDGSGDMTIEQQLGQSNINQSFLIAPTQTLADGKPQQESIRQQLSDQLQSLQQSIAANPKADANEQMNTILQLLLLQVHQNQLLITQNEQILEAIKTSSSVQTIAPSQE